jgi:tRNA pseudouridine55 synthase
VDGFLVINKPKGPSSFQVVRRISKVTGLKAGHAGTLDPQASGLLVVAVGAATRLLQYLPGEPKTYKFGIQFGMQTDTLDSEGKIVKQNSIIPSKASLQKLTLEFSGERMQIPPEFSAIKINGVRAYKMARKGDNPEMRPRKIDIFSIKLEDYEEQNGIAHFTVVCSGGTYVRALARDIASELDTCGFASYVHRTAVGAFSLENSIEVENMDEASKYIISLDKVFHGFPSFQATPSQKTWILNGRDILIDQSVGNKADVFFVYDESNNLIAVLKKTSSESYHPTTVFSSAGINFS